MSNSKKIIIVGGVAGGATAAARLRRLDEKAEIIMFERGEYISFANCGLPYYIGGMIKTKSALTLQTPESFKSRYNIDSRILSEVIKIDHENKIVLVEKKDTGETYTESYDQLILSMGAEPIKLPIDGVDSEGVFTLRNIPDTMAISDFIKERSPKHVAVIGGGYIGVEMADNLKMAKLNVTIIEQADHLIAPLDFDMSANVHQYARRCGVNIILNNSVTKIKETNDKLNILLSKGNLEVDMIIMAVGVNPETKLAKEAGIKLNKRGSIVVDEKMRTSIKGIYAVGDAVEVEDFVAKQKAFIPLAGPANKQGRIAADNIYGKLSTYKGTQGSSILKFFDMSIASTGVNEKKAKELKLDYDKVFTFSASNARYYPGGSSMLIKTIFEKSTGKILGVQIVGFEGVDKRCDIFAVAIRAGMTAKDLIELELCYAPPFSSAKDPVNMAGYVVENSISGEVKNFHWHDVEGLPRDGSVTLLDVRTANEFDSENIDGFINIAVDDLRQNLNKLDKTKPIYVHCQSGLRSYIACGILNGNGFKAYNLSGGYMLYSSVMLEKGYADA